MIGAVLAGLVFGLAVLVRIDGLRDVLPAVVYAGLLIALRRVGARDEDVSAFPCSAGWRRGSPEDSPPPTCSPGRTWTTCRVHSTRCWRSAARSWPSP
ncbi:hypothetical protein ACFQX6_33040 [Streptosporangium lutulentum]